MEERMKKMGEFLLAAMKHCELAFDKRVFSYETTFNPQSEIYRVHKELEQAYTRYKEEVVKCL
jgi:hypothetical protein